MDKKMQLFFTVMIAFASIAIVNAAEWRAVHRDVANDMRSMGYGPSTEEMQRTEGAYIKVPSKDFDNYEQEKNQKGEKIPWVNPPHTITFTKGPRKKMVPVPKSIVDEIAQKRAAENKPVNFEIDVNNQYRVPEEDYNKYYAGTTKEIPRKKMIAVPKSVVDEIAQKRAAENKPANFEIDVNNNYRVPEEDYNKYYYNQLPWYKRWFSGLFNSKPSSSNSSGVLKSYASVPLPTSQTRQRSRISMPKYIAPTAQKTLERAKKLETPYIPTPSSASKALKQSERFGIGYQ